MRTSLVLLSFLCCSTAFAQETLQQRCKHTSGMTIGGQDIDLMRCQIEVANQTIGQQAVALSSLQAQIMLLQSDLAASKDQAAKAAPTPEKKKDGSK